MKTRTNKRRGKDEGLIFSYFLDYKKMSRKKFVEMVHKAIHGSTAAKARKGRK